MAERPEEWISAKEAARLKGVRRRSVYNAAKTGKVIGRQFEGRWMILRASLDDWTPIGHRPRKPPP